MEGEVDERPGSGPEIVLDDHGEVLKGNNPLRLVVSELIKNCAEEGAEKITVTAERGKIVVEDDVQHDNSEALLKNLNRRKPESHKKSEQRVIKGTPGGAGVRWCRHVLETALGGDLSYEAIEDGRIRVIVTWPVS